MSVIDTSTSIAKAARELDSLVQTSFVPGNDGTFSIRTYQDVGPALDHCARIRRADAENRGRFGKRRDFHRAMSVPINVIYAVAQRLGIQRGDVLQPEQSKRIFAELKREEFKLFRTVNDKRL